jgi:hypothetical protein
MSAITAFKRPPGADRGCALLGELAGGGAGGGSVEQAALVTDPERGRCRGRERARNAEVANGRRGVGDGDRREMTITAFGHVFSPGCEDAPCPRLRRISIDVVAELIPPRPVVDGCVNTDSITPTRPAANPP